MTDIDIDPVQDNKAAAEQGWMTPLTPEQGGPAYPRPTRSGPVHEESGKWYFWDETGASRHGPFDTEDRARVELDKYADWLANGPTQLNEDTSPEPVELDPEAAEAKLSAATHDLVEAALHLVHSSYSNALVNVDAMRKLRKVAEKFDLAFAETVTVGKILGLAQAAEGQPALGVNAHQDVRDATDEHGDPEWRE